MTREKHPWIYDLLFLLVFLLAGYLRLTGVNWGEGQHQHPDENFLTGVLGSLRAQACEDASIPADACPDDQKRWLTPGEYFDSKTSPLNPYNRGYSFFVYGNLPMTLVRVAADATGQLDVKTLGRQFSALADLFTIFFLYLLVSRMYGRKVGLLASLFSALTVMQIQQSHFMTVDNFGGMFTTIAMYACVQIAKSLPLARGIDEKAGHRLVIKEYDCVHTYLLSSLLIPSPTLGEGQGEGNKKSFIHNRDEGFPPRYHPTYVFKSERFNVQTCQRHFTAITGFPVASY